MRRFRYLGDPLCLVCCAVYVVNRFCLKPHFASRFLHGYLSDILLIPCALPLVLWLQRYIGLREHDERPRIGEVVFHLLVWSLLFELAGPFIVSHATADLRDIIAYAFGAIFAMIWWKTRGKVVGC